MGTLGIGSMSHVKHLQTTPELSEDYGSRNVFFSDRQISQNVKKVTPNVTPVAFPVKKIECGK